MASELKNEIENILNETELFYTFLPPFELLINSNVIHSTLNILKNLLKTGNLKEQGSNLIYLFLCHDTVEMLYKVLSEEKERRGSDKIMFQTMMNLLNFKDKVCFFLSKYNKKITNIIENHLGDDCNLNLKKEYENLKKNKKKGNEKSNPSECKQTIFKS